MKYSRTCALVIGGSGFTGARLCGRLLRETPKTSVHDPNNVLSPLSASVLLTWATQGRPETTGPDITLMTLAREELNRAPEQRSQDGLERTIDHFKSVA